MTHSIFQKQLRIRVSFLGKIKNIKNVFRLVIQGTFVDFGKIFVLFLIAWALFFGFENQIITFINNTLLQSFIFEDNKEAQILSIFIFLLGLLITYKKFSTDYQLSSNHLGILSTLIISHILFRIRNNITNDFTYLPKDFPISYIDGLIILAFLAIVFSISIKIKIAINLVYKDNKVSQEKIHITDLPINTSSEDILDYHSDALKLANDITLLEKKEPCSIGIIGKWGQGKSSYINLVEKSLDPKKIITVKFNPRHSKNAAFIQEDFFNQLFSVLKNYNSEFDSIFVDYMQAIGIIDSRNILTTTLNLIRAKDKLEEKEKLNNLISGLHKRVVVFIEDFDRLLVDEIIEVLKLIDGNASLNNMVFISAYDKDQVNKILTDKLHGDQAYYTDKFFTWEIQIPLRQYWRIFVFLQNNIFNTIPLNSDDYKNNKATLLANYNLIEDYLPTLRDVKRFINMFSRQYLLINEEIIFRDYLLISLIKYRYPEEYLRIYFKEYVHLSLTEEKYNYTEEKIGTAKSHKIIKFLFNESSNKGPRSINSKNAFSIYFHNEVYSTVRLKEINILLAAEPGDSLDIINDWGSNNLLNDFIDYLNYRNNSVFDTLKQFEQYLHVLFFIAREKYDSIIYILIGRFLYNNVADQLCDDLKIDKKNYKEMLLRHLRGTNGAYPFHIIRKLNVNLLNNEFPTEICFSHDELLSISKEMFSDYAEKNPGKFDATNMELLYCCIESIDPRTKQITLSEDICKKCKIMITNHPGYYIESFVRLGMISSDSEFNSVACEPFWNQIFGDEYQFELFIEQPKLDNTHNIQRVRNFWSLYKHNGFQPIEFSLNGNVQHKIDNNLEEEIVLLNQLLSLESKLKVIIINEINDDNILKFITQQNEIFEQINTINLPIKLKADLLKYQPPTITQQ